MERTKTSEENIILKAIRNSMIRHIQSHNSVLTYNHLKALTNVELLANCHPGERNGYAKLLYKEGVITEEQLKEYQPQHTTGYGSR